jgi:hypothetical protein
VVSSLHQLSPYCRNATDIPIEKNKITKLRRITMEIGIGQKAPDFSIADWQGNAFVLSSYSGQKNLFLVFNRGFF